MIRRVRDALRQKPDLILWLIAFYYVLAVIVRLFRTEGLQADESEQLFVSQFLLVGYGRQPPFYNWVQTGVIWLLGPSILALTLVKNGTLFLTCLFYWLAARQVLRQAALPAIATLGMIALPIMAVLSQRDLSHAIATVMAVSFFTYALLRTLTRPTAFAYALTGIAVGIGTISKYNFVILPVAAILAILPEAELRRRLFDPRMLIAIGLAALICLPHGIWVVENFRAATAGTIEAMHDDATGHPIFDRMQGLADFALAVLETLAVPLAVFLLAFRRSLKACLTPESLWTRVTGRMILISLALVALIAVFGIGASTISQKWLSPFLLLMPLYLCLKLDLVVETEPFALPRMAMLVLTMAIGFLAYLVIGSRIAPYTGHYPKDGLPTMPFLRQVLADGSDPNPAYFMTDDLQLAGSARILRPRADVILPWMNAVSQDDMVPPAKAGLLVWRPRNRDLVVPPEFAALLQRRGIPFSVRSISFVRVPFSAINDRRAETFAYLRVPASPAAIP